MYAVRLPRDRLLRPSKPLESPTMLKTTIFLVLGAVLLALAGCCIGPVCY